MALKRLTTAEMVQISGAWTNNGSDARKAIQKVPELAGILPRIDAAHTTLVAARPLPDDPRLAAIIDEAAELDARHDALVRGVDFVLEGIALLEGSSARAETIGAARSVLTPDGIGIVSTSYRNEAGAATLLASRLPKEATTKALLQSIAVDKKTALATFVDERIEVGTKLGALEDERAKLLASTGGTESPKNVDARNAWIRAVNAFIANAALAELPVDVDTLIFSALRVAEKNADRRGRAAPAAPITVPADVHGSDAAGSVATQT